MYLTAIICDKRVNPQEPTQEMWVQSLSQEDPLEKEMATHSSILGWETNQAQDVFGYTIDCIKIFRFKQIILKIFRPSKILRSQIELENFMMVKTMLSMEMSS